MGKAYPDDGADLKTIVSACSKVFRYERDAEGGIRDSKLTG